MEKILALLSINRYVITLMTVLPWPRQLSDKANQRFQGRQKGEAMTHWSAKKKAKLQIYLKSYCGSDLTEYVRDTNTVLYAVDHALVNTSKIGITESIKIDN